MNTADHEDSVPKVEAWQPKYSSYQLDDEEWDTIKVVYEVLQVRLFFLYTSALRILDVWITVCLIRMPHW